MMAQPLCLLYVTAWPNYLIMLRMQQVLQTLPPATPRAIMQMMSDTSDSDSDGGDGEAFQVPAHALQHTPASPTPPAAAAAAGGDRKHSARSKAATAAVSDAALLESLAASLLDSTPSGSWDRHLGVDASALQASAEFKALFGADVIAAVGADAEDGPPQFDQAAAAAAGAAGKRAQRRAKAAVRAAKRADATRDATSKSRRGGLKLTTPGESWPPPPTKMAGGMFMTQTSAKTVNMVGPSQGLAASSTRLSGGRGGNPVTPVVLLRTDPSTSEVIRREFKYEHGTLYAAAQADYTSRVSTYDPQAVVGLLHSAPWHVDTNLQVAEIQRATRQTDEAAELLKRALYSLEAAWHPQFAGWGAVRVRLPWKDTQNRSLFTALFRHAHSCAKGGAPRTALQLCKLLLQLDPARDPLKALLGMGYFANKAQAFQWLRSATQPPVPLPATSGASVLQSLPLGACGHSGQDASIVLIPSIAYQRALAGHGRMATCLADPAAHTSSTSWSQKEEQEGAAVAVPAQEFPAFGVLLPEAGDDAPVWVSLSKGGADTAGGVTFAPQALLSGVNAVLLFPQLAVRFLTAAGVSSADMGCGKLGGLRAGMGGGGSGAQAGAAGWPTAAVQDWTDPSMAVWAGVLDHPLFQVTPEEDAEDSGAGDNGAAVYSKLMDIAVARDAGAWKDSAAALFLYHAMALAAAASDSSAAAAPGDVPGAFVLHPALFRRVFPGGQAQAASVFQQARGIRHACMCAAAAVDVLSPTDEFDLLPATQLSYPAVGDVWRHYASAVASDFSDDDATMAAEMLAAAGGGGGDPHAGGEELDFAALHAQAAGLGGPIGPILGEGMQTALDMNQNPIALFLNSMLPWARVQGGGQGAPPHEQAHGEEAYDEDAALVAAMEASMRDAEEQ